MILETFGELDAALGGGADQMNPAPRRFRFQVQRAIRRALVQTETAMDTLIQLRKVERRDFWMIAGLWFSLHVFQM